MKGWVLLVVLGLGFAPAFGGDVEDKSKNLKEYQQKLEEQRQKLKKLSGREGSLLGELNRMSAAVEDMDTQIRKLEEDVEELDRRIRGASKQIESLSGEIPKYEERVQERFRSLYIQGRPSLLRVMLSSRSPLELRERATITRRLIEHDRGLVDGYRRTVTDLSSQRTQLQADRASREEMVQRLSQKKEDLSVQRKTRGDLLALVRTQRDFYEKSVEELEAAAKNLSKLLETLRRKEEEDSVFGRMRGKLLPPVVGGRIGRNFGPYKDAKLQTRLHHKGIDVDVRSGAPIQAVFDGQVAYADWFVGYGKIVIVDHGGGYFTLYAHASKVLKKVGDSVTTGERIAEVGDTGSLQGPYLYFELRHKGISQDPKPWFAPGSFN